MSGAGRSFDRGFDVRAGGRQLGAIIASGDRTKDARAGSRRRRSSSTGRWTRWSGPSGGRATAKAIPGARLMMIEGMGHDLPRGVWPQIIDAVAEQPARRAAVRPPRLGAEGEARSDLWRVAAAAALYGEAVIAEACKRPVTAGDPDRRVRAAAGGLPGIAGSRYSISASIDSGSGPSASSSSRGVQ